MRPRDSEGFLRRFLFPSMASASAEPSQMGSGGGSVRFEISWLSEMSPDAVGERVVV